MGDVTGNVTTLVGESLERYACWNPERSASVERKQSLPPHMQSQTKAILGLTPVSGEALVASCSSDMLTLNHIGGFTRFSSKIENLKCKTQILQGKGKRAILFYSSVQAYKLFSVFSERGKGGGLLFISRPMRVLNSFHLLRCVDLLCRETYHVHKHRSYLPALEHYQCWSQ